MQIPRETILEIKRHLSEGWSLKVSMKKAGVHYKIINSYTHIVDPDFLELLAIQTKRRYEKMRSCR